MKTDVVLAGVGGQGVLSVAALIASVARQEGLCVKQGEVHGMAQRGGAVLATLRMADGPIHSDLIPMGSADALLSMEPLEALHGIEGLKNLDSALRPAIYDPTVADERIRISTEEAESWAGRLARECGLFVGTSSGAAYAGCIRVAEQLEVGTIVTILPDGGDRYLSERGSRP